MCSKKTYVLLQGKYVVRHLGTYVPPLSLRLRHNELIVTLGYLFLVDVP